MRTKLLITVVVLLGAGFIPGMGHAQAPLGNGTNYLACVNYNDGPGSSDMTLIVQLEVGGQIVIEEGSDVTYLALGPSDQATGDSLGMDWVDPLFDDSAWDTGVSGVGFSDGDDNTTVPSGRIAIYTRYQFNVANSSAVSSVILRVDYDDQFVAWLNGTEIARSAWLNGMELAWDTTTGGSGNHGSTELAAGKPNPNRRYQEEIDVDFIPVNSVAVEPTGKLGIIWANLKASR